MNFLLAYKLLPQEQVAGYDYSYNQGWTAGLNAGLAFAIGGVLIITFLVGIGCAVGFEMGKRKKKE